MEQTHCARYASVKFKRWAKRYARRQHRRRLARATDCNTRRCYRGFCD